MQHRIDARAHERGDLVERVAPTDFVDQVHEHLLLLIGLAKESAVKRCLQSLARLECQGDRADQRDIDPGRALREDQDDGPVRMREDRECENDDGEREQRPQRGAREQILQSAADKHADVE